MLENYIYFNEALITVNVDLNSFGSINKLLLTYYYDYSMNNINMQHH